ncbi:MAG TPA: hypothetical protein VEJ63_18190 [Planctomycetota bacterium]|nr:hypothetical protein [Planctomycetota bacterium]
MKRFHLSTLLLLMLTSSTLLYLNLAERRRESYFRRIGPELVAGTETVLYFERGFPFTCYSYSPDIEGYLSGWEQIRDTLDYWPHVDEPLLLANIGVGIAILAGIGFVSERLIRRRPAKKNCRKLDFLR